ncbi:pyridoxamine 5'-phosphate oxidase family protein [Paraburkholderia oxyphila]|uniref:pyridoxamine 5'-phosphate oxidase family protein n=1 Tax=Paraburkholderia oxyphila TaxID=614212 RepID=UPI0005B9E60D|nr:pyridoxamine 5'-phosphate oxidase family protein [Paraburkholderia oxyphila]
MSEFSSEKSKSPWHAGELAMQQTTGVAEAMTEVGRQVIREYMPDRHREFFEQLPLVFVGTVDHAQQPWATVVTGTPGFARSPDTRTLELYSPLDSADPASAGVWTGGSVGLLGIDLSSRRRNRMNGIVVRADCDGFSVAVQQSFGNCPSYIQRRSLEVSSAPRRTSEAQRSVGGKLDQRAREMVEKADTLFIATYADVEGNYQVDIGHRGGRTGFVRIDEDGTLTFPDFAGNSFFNTLGNILLSGKAGLLFADFANGDLLQITGSAAIVFDSPEVAAFEGAERIVRCMPQEVVFRPGALALRWKDDPDGLSVNTEMTGDWATASARLKERA